MSDIQKLEQLSLPLDIVNSTAGDNEASAGCISYTGEQVRTAHPTTSDYLAWKCLLLGDIAGFVGGNGFPEKFQGGSHGDIPFFKVSDMSLARNERFLTRANNYVSRKLAASQGWSVVPAGGVVFTKVGAALLLNRRRITTTDCLVDNNMMAAVPGAEVHPIWLYWWLQTIDFGVFVQPGALPSVNQAHLRSLRILLPSYSEQSRIAAVLDTVDEAIAKTEAVIAKLKQVRAGLLHDLLTRGLDEHGQLRDSIAHPEQFQDSPLGRIPREWQCRTLEEAMEWFSGGTPNRSQVTWWHGNVPILTPKDMKAFELSDTIEHVTNEAARVGSRLMPSETVFIVVRGMILAHTFPVCLCTRPFAFNQDIKAVRGKQGLDNRFLAHWFVGNSALFLRKATEATHGTKKLDLDELHRVHIGVPSPEEQRAIVEHIEALDLIASVETAELAKLGALKSGLMTDLLTGRVRVPEHFGVRRHDAALSSRARESVSGPLRPESVHESGDTSPHSKAHESGDVSLHSKRDAP